MTHEPIWLLDWFKQKSRGPNLRQLVRAHLRGRARVHLAGDLHFYMRHSWTPAQAQQQQCHPPPAPAHADPAGSARATRGPDSMTSPKARAGSRLRDQHLHQHQHTASPARVASPSPPAQPEPHAGNGLHNGPNGPDSAAHAGPESGLRPPRLQMDGPGADAVESTALPAVRPCPGCEARAAWSRHPLDPEHLVVNGGGGAFLHPTHVFAGCRFAPKADPAAEAAAGLYAAVMQPCTCRWAGLAIGRQAGGGARKGLRVVDGICKGLYAAVMQPCTCRWGSGYT